MPRAMRLSEYWIGDKSADELYEAAKSLPRLSEKNWQSLEKKLGCSLDTDVRARIENIGFAVRVATENHKSAPSASRQRKQLQKIAGRLKRERLEIFQIYNPKIYDKEWSTNRIQKIFFMWKSRAIKSGNSLLPLVAFAMDALIVVCLAAARQLEDPRHSKKEDYYQILFGIVLRELHEKWNLPHKIRKDVDKQSTASGGKFIDFYCELLTLVGCGWKHDPASLGQAILREARAISLED